MIVKKLCQYCNHDRIEDTEGKTVGRCIIEQYFTRFSEKIEVRDVVNTESLLDILAENCSNFEEKELDVDTINTTTTIETLEENEATEFESCDKCDKKFKAGERTISLVVSDDLILSDAGAETFFDQVLCTYHKECSPFKETLFKNKN